MPCRKQDNRPVVRVAPGDTIKLWYDDKLQGDYTVIFLTSTIIACANPETVAKGTLIEYQCSRSRLEIQQRANDVVQGSPCNRFFLHDMPVVYDNGQVRDVGVVIAAIGDRVVIAHRIGTTVIMDSAYCTPHVN